MESVSGEPRTFASSLELSKVQIGLLFLETRLSFRVDSRNANGFSKTHSDRVRTRRRDVGRGLFQENEAHIARLIGRRWPAPLGVREALDLTTDSARAFRSIHSSLQYVFPASDLWTMESSERTRAQVTWLSGTLKDRHKASTPVPPLSKNGDLQRNVPPKLSIIDETDRAISQQQKVSLFIVSKVVSSPIRTMHGAVKSHGSRDNLFELSIVFTRDRLNSSHSSTEFNAAIRLPVIDETDRAISQQQKVPRVPVFVKRVFAKRLSRAIVYERRVLCVFASAVVLPKKDAASEILFRKARSGHASRTDVFFFVQLPRPSRFGILKKIVELVSF